MTARQWALGLAAVTGAVAREIGWQLVALGDVLDPPPPRPPADPPPARCPDTLPDAWSVTW